MEGAARDLFVPLSLAVGFSMITSYLLSSTFVPVRVGLAAEAPSRRTPRTRPLRGSPSRTSSTFTAGCCTAACCRALGAGSRSTSACRSGLRCPGAAAGDGNLSQGGFRPVPAAHQGADRDPHRTHRAGGRETLRVIAAGGWPGEPRHLRRLWRRLAVQLYDQHRLPVDRRAGRSPCMRVALKKDAGIRIERTQTQVCAKSCPGNVGGWLRGVLQQQGLPAQQIDARVAELRFSFEPADIINEVMSFGSPTPDRGGGQRAGLRRQPGVRQQGLRATAKRAHAASICSSFSRWITRRWKFASTGSAPA